MADSSSIMDWSPQTPPPSHNPYQGNYVPGGWPVEAPTPPPATAGTFAMRRPNDGWVPFAKRVCQGLGAVVKHSVIAAATVSRHTVDATTVVATVPVYYIVRQVRQRQRNARPQQQQQQRRRRVARPAAPPITDSPWNRIVATVENQPRALPPYLQERAPELELSHPQETAQTTTFPLATATQVTARPAPPPKSDHPVVQYGLYEIPELRPAYILEGIKQAKEAARQRRKKQSHKRSLYPGIPKFTPPRQTKPAELQTPEQQVQKPLPELPKLQTPYPPLQPIPATPPSELPGTPQSELIPGIPQSEPIPGTPPSATATDDSATPTPSNQLQVELIATAESDTDDAATVVSQTWETRKRRRDTQGSREDESGETPQTAKRIQLGGPSLGSPDTPTPVIVVQETSAAVNAEVPNIPDDTLLSPPRVRLRRIGTPRSSKKYYSPKTPESEFSSTCDCSPGYLPPIYGASPAFSDISSTYNGSPPNSDEDARLFRMIMAGGGSPTPESKRLSQNDKEPERPVSNPNAVPEASENQIADQPPATPETKAGFTANAEAIEAVTSQHGAQGSISGTAQQSSGSEEPSNPKQEVKPESSTSAPHNENEASKSGNIKPEDLAAQLCSANEALESGNIKPKDSAVQNVSGNEASESGPRTPPRGKQNVTFSHSINDLTAKDSNATDTDSFKTPEHEFARLTLEEYAGDDQTPKATPHSSEKMQRFTRAESKRLQILEEKQHYEIAALPKEWEEKVQKALRSGHGDYKPTDLTRVVPLLQGRGTDNWLNDEVINGYLKLIVAHGKQNDRPTQVPTHHAFVSFFYNNLESRGYDSVKRWASRAKIGGKNLFETEQVFIPINSGMHWTLCVVSGKNKTITHYNSLRGNGKRYVETVKQWVKEELGGAFKEEEWTLDFAGESPQQSNMDDCGVFTITSARQIMLGLTPMSYVASQIPLQRRRIVAELVNGGLIKSDE